MTKERKSYHAFWTISQNFGDLIGPYLIEKMTETVPIWSDHKNDSGKFIVGGSILNWSDKNSIVWGAGVASLLDRVNPQADIRAVRGPLSRAKALADGASCPAVYGDPGLLLPLVTQLDMREARSVQLGVIPHYVDQVRIDWSSLMENEDVAVFDVFGPIPKIMAGILDCGAIASSSLHGLVVAAALSVPFQWVRFSDSIGGDGTKYRDFFMSIGLDVGEPVDCRESVESVYEIEEFHRAPRQVIDKLQADLLASCPFPSRFRK